MTLKVSITPFECDRYLKMHANDTDAKKFAENLFNATPKIYLGEV